jgi:hypothetical protein
MSNYDTQKKVFADLGYKETYIGFFEKAGQEIWFDSNSGGIMAYLPVAETETENAYQSELDYLSATDWDNGCADIELTEQQILDFVKKVTATDFRVMTAGGAAP